MDNQTYRNQFRRVYKAFLDKPKTMLQVATETGILRGNICWFVRDMRRQNKITVTKKGRCPISKHRAQFLTTDPEIVDKENGGNNE